MQNTLHNKHCQNDLYLFSSILPFFPPASTTMLQIVMRSSMLIASTASPVNSMAL